MQRPNQIFIWCLLLKHFFSFAQQQQTLLKKKILREKYMCIILFFVIRSVILLCMVLNYIQLKKFPRENGCPLRPPLLQAPLVLTIIHYEYIFIIYFFTKTVRTPDERTEYTQVVV